MDFLNGLRGVVFFIPGIMIGFIPFFLVAIPISIALEPISGEDLAMTIATVLSFFIWWMLILASKQLERFVCFFFNIGMWLITGEIEGNCFDGLSRRNKSDKLFAGFLIALYCSVVCFLGFALAMFVADLNEVVFNIVATVIGVLSWGLCMVGGFKIWEKFVTNSQQT